MDFLILYEEKVRELESACLLKNELEKLGYTAKIDLIYSFRKNFYNAKVLILPHLYNDLQIYQFVSKFRKRRCKIINLQYEQVVRETDSKNGYGIPTGDAKKSVVFCWGQHEANRYSNDKKQRAVITGCLPMDFNLPKYDGNFMKREQLFMKYGVDPSKKTILYISSFTLADSDDERIKFFYNDTNEYMSVFSDISRQSKNITVEFLNNLSRELDYNVIYRPHPAEYSDSGLSEIMENNNNFHVIPNESIRQWIRVSDCLISWFSTSIIDAFYAQKKCTILRPVRIPRELDCPLYYGARTVSTYEELISEVNQQREFPIRIENIKEYYSNKLGEECLPDIIKACKAVYEDDSYAFTYISHNEYRGLKQQCKAFFVEILFELCRHFNLTRLYRIVLKRNTAKRDFFVHIQKELYHMDKEIKNCCKRFNNV